MSNIYVEVLADARKYIEQEDWCAVCTAIHYCKYDNGLLYKIAGDQIKSRIRRSLDNRKFVTEWLCDKHQHIFGEAESKYYRLAWIDWMIEGWAKTSFIEYTFWIVPKEALQSKWNSVCKFVKKFVDKNN